MLDVSTAPETDRDRPAPHGGAGLPPLVPVVGTLVLAALVLGAVLTATLSRPQRLVPPARFEDATAESGIRFRHTAGGPEAPTTLGGGVAVLDFDADGAPDLFFVNGSSWPWQEEEEVEAASPRARSSLFRNDGRGHFSDVTAASGLPEGFQGMGAAAADYDNDGWPDLFVTGVGGNRLFRNRGGGRFEDVTESAGVAGDGHTWSTGALWWDLDDDGRLDLVVCNYARWPREIGLDVAFKIAGVGRSYGAPAGFVSASPTVYLNRGDGTFAEPADGLGLRNLAPETRLPRPETLGVAPLDANGDGRIDLCFFHHAAEPAVFLNLGGGTYREWSARGERREGASAGLLAFGAAPPLRGGEAPLARVLTALRPAEGPWAALPARLGFARLDYDLDGRVDLFSGGGRAEPELNRFDGGRDFASAPEAYWNTGDGWQAAALSASGGRGAPLVARGLVAGDFDGDGDPDVVVGQNDGEARLFRNDHRQGTAWLKIRLRGTRGPRDGFGARVEVHTPRLKLSRWVLPPMGYLSQSDTTLVFGLGEDARVRRIVVTWPGGVRQEVAAPGTNRTLVIAEPDGGPENPPRERPHP